MRVRLERSWHATVAAAAGLVICSGLTTCISAQNSATAGSPAPTASRVPPAGTWGTPPSADQRPYLEPELPELAGWSRYVPAESATDAAIAGDLLVYTTQSNELHALDLFTGAETWSICLPYSWDSELFASPQWCVLSGEDWLDVCSQRDGTRVLSLAGKQALAIAGDQLWTTTIRYRDENQRQYDMVDVQLVDIPSGAVRQKFDTGRLTATGSLVPEAASGLPVRTEREFLLLKPDGVMDRYPVSHPTFAAQLASHPAGLLVVEYFDPFGTPCHAVERRGSMTNLEIILQQALPPPAVACTVRLLDPATADVIWKRNFCVAARSTTIYARYLDGRLFLGPLDHSTGEGNPSATASLPPGIELLDGDLILDVTTGISVNTNWKQAEPTLDFSNFVADNGCVYFAVPMIDYYKLPHGIELPQSEQEKRRAGPRLVTLDCAQGRTSTFKLPAQGALDLIAAGGGMLYGAYRYATPATAPLQGATTQLIAIQLDDEGQPQHGAMQRLAYPAPDFSPVDRFLATRDPQQDAELMTSLAALGNTGLAHLLDRFQELSAAQFSALIALCRYLDLYSPGESYNHVAVDQVIETARQFPREALTPVVIEWLDDPALAQDRRSLTGLLAACGGPQARRWLDREYDRYADSLRQTEKPPYSLQELVEDQSCESFAQATDQAGAAYLAYTWSGLLSSREIYLAVDSNADGRYEEVLITGCKDFYHQFYPPSEFVGPAAPLGPLALKVDGDVLELKHHEALYWPWIRYRNGWPLVLRDLRCVRLTTTMLSLAELRRDADSDGLTDQLERELLTDPLSADTDGDGIGDALDRYPLTNTQRQDRVARGVWRALVYALNAGVDANAAASSPLHPWRALYITLDGCGPVAWSPDPGGYGIGLAGSRSRKRYDLLLRGEIPFDLDVHVIDLKVPPPARELPGNHYTPMFGWIEPQVARNNPQRVEYIVYIDNPSGGEAVILVDVAGELYPAQLQGLWIS